MALVERLPTNKAPSEGALVVWFNRYEVELASTVARLRQESARALGRRPRRDGSGKTAAERAATMLANAEVGCLGEFAASLALGREWIFDLGGCGGPDLAPNVEVKTRSLFHRDDRSTFRFQIWRKNVGDLLVGCLMPRWTPEFPPRVSRRPPFVARVWVCGVLPVTEDLYTNGAHQMIPGKALLPLETLESLKKETVR